MKLALAQLLVEGGEPERNLQRAQKMIEKAATQNADLILLPETIDFAWTHPSALNENLPIPGVYSNFFCELAKKHHLFICLGLSEKEGDKNYNSAILINQKGEIILKHRKINLLEVEFLYYEVGQKLEVVDTSFGKIGLNICADNYRDSLHLGHALARMGAQIILSPSSWTVDYHVTEIDEPYYEKWVKPFQLLASMHDIVIVSATSVGYIVGGPYVGKKSIGKSLVIDKNGILLEGAFNEFAGDLKIIDFEIPLTKVKGTQIGESLKKKGYQFDL